MSVVESAKEAVDGPACLRQLGSATEVCCVWLFSLRTCRVEMNGLSASDSVSLNLRLAWLIQVSC